MHTYQYRWIKRGKCEMAVGGDGRVLATIAPAHFSDVFSCAFRGKSFGEFVSIETAKKALDHKLKIGGYFVHA